MKLSQYVGVVIFILVQGCAHHQTVDRLPREHEYKPKEIQQLQASVQKTLDKTQALPQLKMHSLAPH